MNVIYLSFNPAGDEEPLWEMRQRQSKEQAKLLELQLIKQNKKIINDSIKKKKNVLTNLSSDFGIILDSDNNTRMGTRTRERNNNSNSNSNSNSPTPSLQPR